jgi:hypothetical protein
MALQREPASLRHDVGLRTLFSDEPENIWRSMVFTMNALAQNHAAALNRANSAAQQLTKVMAEVDRPFAGEDDLLRQTFMLREVEQALSLGMDHLSEEALGRIKALSPSNNNQTPEFF